jgi:hypothetical protein
MRKYRVIVWGTGMVGEYALRFLLRNEHMQLVGVKVYSSAKEGKDAADLVSSVKLAPTGVKATRDADRIHALDADVVIYAPFDPLTDPSIPGSASSAWVPDLLKLLRSGKNVIATMLSIAHWRHLKNGEAFRDQINAACREGNSTLFVTGIDPGFTPDAIAFALSGIVGEVTQINTWEVLDYGPYPVLEAMKALGFGKRPEELSSDGMETIRTCWGGCPHLLADAFGVTLSGLRVEGDFSLAKETYTSESGLKIEKGTIEALKFKVIGSVEGKDRFIVNHVTRMGLAAAPQWRQIGRDGGYGIEIDGYPPFKGEFPFGASGGTGASWSDAMVMTSARCVNSIEPVVLAGPGYRTFLDLPPLGGRYALSRA